MKKFFMFFIMMVSSLMMISCDNDQKPQEGTYPGVTYNVTVTGDADGNLQVTFPNGNFAMNGTAGLVFAYSNDTVQVTNGVLLTEEAILEKGDSTQLKALEYANAYVEENFAVTTAGGTYDVRIKGYVKEPITGFVIAIDRRFTNRKE